MVWVPTANQIRNLSGWEAYGYAQGMATHGGLAYGQYFSDAKRSAKITIEDDDGKMREVTYDSAENIGE